MKLLQNPISDPGVRKCNPVKDSLVTNILHPYHQEALEMKLATPRKMSPVMVLAFFCSLSTIMAKFATPGLAVENYDIVFELTHVVVITANQIISRGCSVS